MNTPAPRKATKAEWDYIRDLERESVFAAVDRGQARILRPREYPLPIRRFLARERRTLHVPLSVAAKRRLEEVSRTKGVRPVRLARQWIEQQLARAAG
jgi:hypothetical protein